MVSCNYWARPKHRWARPSLVGSGDDMAEVSGQVRGGGGGVGGGQGEEFEVVMH